MRRSANVAHDASLFEPSINPTVLQQASIRGGLHTAVGQTVIFGIRLIGTVVLARLLLPADFGLVSMVVAVVGFANIFKDLGLSTATIQRQHVTQGQVSTLFWVNLGVACATTVLVAASAPVLAWFYGEPRLVYVTLLLSIMFLLSGMSVQHLALLRRQMRFGRIAASQGSAAVLAVIGAIALATLGFGYWALVWMHVLLAGFSAVTAWIAGPWRPSRPLRGTGVRSMLRFGAGITGFNVVNYFSRNLDNVLIGYAWGPAPLGLYANAYQLLMVPITQIRSPLDAVALPAMSRLADSPTAFSAYYRRFIAILAVVTMPLVAGLAASANDLVPLLLGEQWREAAPIFAVLAVAGMIQPVAGTQGLVMISLGRTNRYFRYGVILAVVYIGSFVAGLPWGPVGVAASYAAANYLVLIPLMHYVFKDSPITPRMFFGSIAEAFGASLIVGLLLYLVAPQLGITSPLIRLAVNAATVSLLYIALAARLVATYPNLAVLLKPAIFNRKRQRR